METQRFKVIFVGDGGVGKTTFITRHLTGDFEKKYTPTEGVEVSPLTFTTSKGPMILNVWDCAGQEKYSGECDGYWNGANACVLMFDVTSRVSYENMNHWYSKVRSVCGDIPIVMCGNKVDVKDRKVFLEDTRTNGVEYFDVSSKSNYNFDKPFLWVFRQLLKDNSLSFVEI